MNILLTGGAGYIGSHTAVALAKSGHSVVAADNFSNSSPEAIRRVSELTGQRISCFDMDIRNTPMLADILLRKEIQCVIHFAGYKAVNESLSNPLLYYENNIASTVSVLEAMEDAGVSNLIFSSSASVYGMDAPSPITEDAGIGHCSNPYSRTKAICEQIIQDAAAASQVGLRAVLLRYFNPVGAHESGMIGENPHGIPNNLMPYICQVAAGILPELTIFGGDYDTPDGTCLRDFIHVMDLAEAHASAVQYLSNAASADVDSPAVLSINIGTGTPYSVLEMVKTFSTVNRLPISYHIGARRDGDIPALYADVTRAHEVLHWHATRTLANMCRDAWNWQQQNPEGYWLR